MDKQEFLNEIEKYFGPQRIHKKTIDEQISRSFGFALKIAKTGSYDLYVGLRNAKINRVQHNTITGKLGEYIAASFLLDIGVPIEDIKIDLEIRYGAKKGFLPDFNICGVNVHVKACDMETKEKYGNSWTFQWANKDELDKDSDGKVRGRDKIFYEQCHDDIIMLTYIHTVYKSSNKNYICGIFPWDVARHFLRNPKVKDYIGLKKCLYEEDFADMSKAISILNDQGHDEMMKFVGIWRQNRV